jgi:hypothetical protein
MGDRERSRSPDRNGDGGGAPAANGGGAAGEEAEGVKLYVGNLDYCECSCFYIII